MRVLAFSPTDAPITDPITKFGGQPVWIAGPMWPLSRRTRQLMRFICQVKLPPALRQGSQEMAYIFMTETDQEYVEGTWLPDGGENAVILQPSPFDVAVETMCKATGPTLRTRRTSKSGLLGALFKRSKQTLVETELNVTEIDADESEERNGYRSKIGGQPNWLQGDDTPAGGPWDLLIQIDSTEPAYEINLGDAGVGYAFIRRDGRAARFLWQCV